ncbi:MAG: response regulator transcription factor, partial [Myxococcota bacterium]
MNDAGPTPLLLVEDDLKLRGLLVTYLTQHGFDVRAQADGESAIRAVEENDYDLVVLDVMLPGIDGYRVCRELRREFDGGVVMLTGRRGVRDQVSGLELGADDYITKPVDPAVLVARLKSLLRRLGRVRPTEEGATVRCGTLMIALDRRVATGPNGDLGPGQTRFGSAR